MRKPEGSKYTSCGYKMHSFKVILAQWRVSRGVELSEDCSQARSFPLRRAGYLHVQRPKHYSDCYSCKWVQSPGLRMFMDHSSVPTVPWVPFRQHILTPRSGCALLTSACSVGTRGAPQEMGRWPCWVPAVRRAPHCALGVPRTRKQPPGTCPPKAARWGRSAPQGSCLFKAVGA